jgi:drug/metabolite transporter (DMT)-like permease
VTTTFLYGGAAIASLGKSRADLEAPLPASRAPRLLAIGLVGALLAPVCFAWGLQHTSAVTASLLLNLEVAWTLVLARIFLREPIGERVVPAVAFMTAGGACLVTAGFSAPMSMGVGALAVIAGSFGWALDNVLTRPLAEFDSLHIVRWKGAIGAAIGAILAVATHETWPSWSALLGLTICGATGYGASLRLYLLAQRQMGAARTSSIFALAPFVGAAAAWSMGDRALDGSSLLAAVLLATGVYLHARESHHHAHTHEPLEHEHSHRHDDGHHDHQHGGSVVAAEHSHLHRHDAVVHDHPHAPDVHHAHGHKRR